LFHSFSSRILTGIGQAGFSWRKQKQSAWTGIILQSGCCLKSRVHDLILSGFPQGGISVSESSAALQLLGRLGLVRVLPDGNWECRHDVTLVHSLKPGSPTIIRLQRIMRMAEAAVIIPSERRMFRGTILAISEADIPEYKKRIQQFSLELEVGQRNS